MRKLVMILPFCANAMNIFVYDDRAEWANGTYELWKRSMGRVLAKPHEVRKIDKDEIIKGDWKKSASLLIIPGGADKIYHQQLQGSGNQQIKDYVNNGGKLLGVCAGAYYCAKRVHFTTEGVEIIEDRELGFFDDVAFGPIVPYFINTKKGARVFDVTFACDYAVSKLTDQQLVKDELKNELAIAEEVDHAYYNGGCYFPFDSKNNCEYLAKIVHQNEEKWMIVGMQIGSGYVIASGVHPETCSLDYQDCAPEFADQLSAKEQNNGAYGSLKRILRKFEFEVKDFAIKDATEDAIAETARDKNSEMQKKDAQQTRSDETIIAKMHGCVEKYLVKNGDCVKKGDALFVISTMKMEMIEKAPCDGIVQILASIRKVDFGESILKIQKN